MGQLRVQQADGVAPRAESARPILYASFPRYLGDFVLWNKIANLAQKVKPTTCWFDCFFLFHPCRVAGSKRQANTFFHFLWDGSGPNSSSIRRPLCWKHWRFGEVFPTVVTRRGM